MTSPDKALKNARPVVLFIGLMVILYALNYASVQMFKYPFAYCALRPVGYFFLGWWQIVHLMALAFFVYAIWSKNFGTILLGFFVVIVMFGAPQFVDTILRLDGSCG